MNKMKEPNEERNQVIFTLFIMLCPVLIMSIVGMIPEWSLKLALFVYEAILLSNFINDYYKRKDI